MLALSHERDVIAGAWHACEQKALLPREMALRFMQAHGAMPLHFESQRSFHRFYLRGKAVLKRGDETFGAYSKDVSRQGVGFLSPVQLMPLEQVRLRIPSAELCLEVTRCRRITNQCFEVGARFIL